ncbi:hypothetical protein HanRHA438_Chr11g0485231 [Helianthus annuus]|nr:hypothetical protein HanRHA438_Chr11g0485231 [Helianthus annuus]
MCKLSQYRFISRLKTASGGSLSSITSTSERLNDFMTDDLPDSRSSRPLFSRQIMQPRTVTILSSSNGLSSEGKA